MINGVYHDKPLIFIGVTFRKKLVSHHRAMNVHTFRLQTLNCSVEDRISSLMHYKIEYHIIYHCFRCHYQGGLLASWLLEHIASNFGAGWNIRILKNLGSKLIYFRSLPRLSGLFSVALFRELQMLITREPYAKQR